MSSSLLITQAPVATDGKSRLIPVLRQSRRPRVLPRFAGSRLHVDLSADADASGYEVLLRALHGAPKYTRPPIGRNPFANPEGVSAAGAASQATLPERTRDLTRSLRAARTAGAAAFGRPAAAFSAHRGGTADQRHDELMRVIGTHAEYLRLLLQAAQAGELSANRFAEEIEHVISPKGWSSSGPVRIVELPYAVGWAAHHLVGAALLEQGKAEQAVQCAREPIQVSPGTRHAVFEIGRLTGWPVHLGHSNEAWESLRRLPAQLQWISTDL